MTSQPYAPRHSSRGRLAVLATLVVGMLSVAGVSWSGPLRLAQNWEQLSPQQRSQATQNFQRFQRMPPQSQQQVERRYENFQQMPSSEQDRIRRNFDTYRNMSPDQRQDFMDRYRRYQGGPR